jgi:hypothetical protein
MLQEINDSLGRSATVLEAYKTVDTTDAHFRLPGYVSSPLSVTALPISNSPSFLDALKLVAQSSGSAAVSLSSFCGLYSTPRSGNDAAE